MVEGLSAVLLAFHGIFTLALNARFASPLAQSDQPMNECLLVTINCFTLVICAISMPPLPHSLQPLSWALLVTSSSACCLL